ncbi:adhesion factor FAF [Finegoldia magna]|uniref:adhesion factor FAF n=1 Tax=Finegoldia magna TaxID=1260 RepID=UPI0012B027B1|nr:adhesion factor FAF [Finegoldia magna]MSB17055.1 cell wall protein [Finegoldia magna]MSD45860.1 cell wall protein [Finegoldia magna]
MKLNKKLLTAALAGALIVTAVPAGTFAEEAKGNTKVNTNLNKYLTPAEAAARVNELSKEINDLSARRNAIVAQAWEKGKTVEGTIEKLQRLEMAAKAEYESAKTAYEGATKAWEAAKNNEEKARLAKIAAEDAAEGKLGEYNKLAKAAEEARDAAIVKAEREQETTNKNAERKYETARTNKDAAKIARNKLQTSYNTAVAEGAEAGHISQLRKDLEKAELALKKAESDELSALAEVAEVRKAAEETKNNAVNQAKNDYKAEMQRLDYIYKLNGNYGDKVAELTKIERAKINAQNAYADAQKATEGAHKAYLAAEKTFDAASKAYAEANQKTYKVTEDLKSIEKQLKEKFVAINEILSDQNKNINSLTDKLNADMIKELEDFSKLTSSEQFAKIAELQKELAKLKKEYAKTSEGIQQVKKLVTYQFHVKDTEGKGVQGLTLKLTNVDDTSKVYAATSDANGLIQFKSMVEGKYTVEVTKVPTGYDVYQDGKKIDSVKALFRAESEVKAENNAEEAKKDAKKEEKGNKRIDLPSVIDTTTDNKEQSSDKKEDEKVIDKGTIVVEKKKKDNKDNKDNKKPENKKKPAMPAKPMKKKLPKAGAAAEAATIAAAAMATMGGAYLSLKKRK